MKALEAIRRLSPIPEERFISGRFYDRHEPKCCAVGHLHRLRDNKGRYPDEDEKTPLNPYQLKENDEELYNLCYGEETKKVLEGHDLGSINNHKRAPFSQATPKKRVLAALRKLHEAGL